MICVFNGNETPERGVLLLCREGEAIYCKLSQTIVTSKIAFSNLYT